MILAWKTPKKIYRLLYPYNETWNGYSGTLHHLIFTDFNLFLFILYIIKGFNSIHAISILKFKNLQF